MKKRLPDQSAGTVTSGCRPWKFQAPAACLGLMSFLALLFSDAEPMGAADKAPPLLGDADVPPIASGVDLRPVDGRLPTDSNQGWRQRSSPADAVAPIDGWRPRGAPIASPTPNPNGAPALPNVGGATPARFYSDGTRLLPVPPAPSSLLPVNAVAPDEGPPLRPDVLPPPEKLSTSPEKLSVPPQKLLPPEKLSTPPTPQSIKPMEQPPDARAALLLAAARNAVARGLPAEAVPRFEEYLQLYPNDRQVRREYAGLLVQVDRVKAAIEQFKSLLVDEPDNAALLVPLADAYLQSKEFRKAADNLRKAIERAPGNLEYAVKLARSLAFAGDSARAFEVFDKYLGKLSPDDERVPKTFGALLIDLGKPEEALRFLEPLREENPDDLEVLAYLIRANARLGRRAKTQELIADLAARKPGTIPIRLELAEALYQASDLEAASQVYGQVLQADAANVRAQLGMARVYIELCQPREAFRTLQATKATGPAQRSYLLAWAEFHQLVGEYTQAKQIYHSFLEKDEADFEVRLALAKLYEFVRDDEKAKASYAKIPADASQFRAARLGIISTLTTQRRFPEAIEMARRNLAETANDPSARAMLARVLAKAHKYLDAETLLREYLRNETRNEPGIAEARLTLGKILLDQHKTAEAAVEFEQALASPSGRVALGFYGLARARMLIGAPEQARQLFDAAAAYLGEPRARLLMADLFADDHDDVMAGELCQAVVLNDSANLAALIRLVDVRQRQASFSGHIDEAMAVGESILRLSPINVRGLMATARCYSIVRKFTRSVQTYDKLISADPEFLAPRLERARVLFSDHARSASAAAYAQIIGPPGGASPLGLAAPNPDGLPYLEPFAGPRISYDILHNEITRTGGTGGTGGSAPGTETQSSPPGAFYDAVARSAEALEADLESRAKSLKGWRNFASIPIYKQLETTEPSNTEGLFDLGQVYSATLQTRQAIATYTELLEVDPQHRDGSIALERASAELDPQLRFNQDLFVQRGRGGLAAIDRFEYTTAARVPIGDENEFVQAAFSRIEYAPVAVAPVDGNIISFRGQEKAAANLLFYGQANIELYEAGGFHDRVTFDTGVQYAPSDFIRTFFSGFMENVAESSGSVAQDIHRGGIRFGGDIRPLDCWDIGGNYRFAVYSDNNNLNEFNLINEVQLTFLPTQLKWVTVLNYESFAHNSIINPNDPNEILDAVHPYYSPKNFSYYETRLEWTQYLSRDFFAHANVCYYSIQLGTGWDNNFNNYAHFRLLLNYDISSWATIGADANYTLSQVYRSIAASTYLIVRFPFFER
jgi:tetratricopeptide (TPR) repeat protein